MKTFIFFILQCLLFSASLALLPGFTRGRVSDKGEMEFCFNNRPHKLTYDVNSTHGTFIDLNSAHNLKLMDCNTGATKIALGFLYPWDQEDFKKELEAGQPYQTFVTGRGPWECKDLNGNSKPLLARVDDFSVLTGFGLELTLSEAKYDQIYEDAHLKLGESSNWAVCNAEKPQVVHYKASNVSEEHVCIGYNSRNCETANGPIQVWSNQYFSVICEECFIILEANVFFEVKITDWSLTNLSVGYTDGAIKASFIFEFLAHLNWGTGIDKNLSPVVQDINIVDFFIGPIPFHFYFNVPVDLQAQADFNAQAEVTLGAAAQMDIGAMYVMWDYGLGWRGVADKPTFKWTPTITRPTAKFNAGASISLTPQFIAHFDNLFTSTTQVQPLLTATAQGQGTLGKGAWVCASMDYSVTASTVNTLDISIPWFDIFSVHTWTHTWWTTGTVPIGKICANVTGDPPSQSDARPLEIDARPLEIDARPLENNVRPLEINARASSTEETMPPRVHRVVVPPAASRIVTVDETPRSPPAALAPRAPLQQYADTYPVCVNGRPHEVVYNVTVDGKFLKVEEAEGITNITCNLDNTRVLLSFSSSSYATAYTKQLTVWGTFLTAGIKFKCNDGNMLRRVLSWNVTGNNLEVKTTGPRYSEIFQDASISFGPSSSAAALAACAPPPGDKAHICLPINANDNCTHSAGPFVVFQNQYVTLTCSNCFLGLTMDIFFDIKMDGFALEKFDAGFENINLNGAIVLDWLAHLHYSTGVDRTFPLISPTTVVGIWIGPVPLTINMGVPVEIYMNADFFATATATIGAIADWNIGSASVEWDWIKGWKSHSPNPKLTWTEVTKAPTAQFTASAEFAIMPKWQMHVDGFYGLMYTLDPHLNMNAQGNATMKSGKMCATLTDDIDLIVQSEIEIAIPWTSIHFDMEYGPKTIWTSGTRTIGTKCITVS